MPRYLLIISLVAAFAAVGLPALAQERAPLVVAQEDETTTTVAGEEETTVPIPEPAVPAEEPGASPEEPAWTYRFLLPTAVLISLLVVVGIIVGYFVKVTRSRYRIVE